TREIRSSRKPGTRVVGFRQSHDDGFRQPKIDNFHGHRIRVAGFVMHDHQIARFEIPMDESVRLSCDESTCHLNAYFQRKIRWNEPMTADVRLDGFSFDQLHGIETSTGLGLAKMKDSSYIWVPQLGGRACLAPKSVPRIRVSRIAG